MRHKGSRAGSTASVSGRRHVVRTPLAAAIVAVLVTAVAHPMLPQRPQASSLPSNPTAADRFELVSQSQAVSVDGVRRTYRSIAPLHVTSRLPLLVVLHGRGESGSVV